MKNLKKTTTSINLPPYSASILSGLLVGLACWLPQYAVLLWIGLLPFFYVLKTTSPSHLWRHGLAFGMAAGMVFQYWIWESSETLVGLDILIAIGAYLMLAVVYALLPLTFSLVISFWLKWRKKANFDLFVLPALWVSLEWVHLQLFSSLPWTNLYLGYTQFEFILLIQLASITGVWGISFIMVLVSLLFVQALQARQLRPVGYAFFLFSLLTIGGWWSVQQYTPEKKSSTFKVSLLQENFPTGTEWNATTGDSLAQIFLSLNQKAVSQKADLVLWSESVVPWSFRPDDHLVLESLKTTASIQAEHIIGMAFPTDTTEQQFYNAALQFQPDGRLTGMYKKNYLLTFFEAPFFSMLPFLDPFNRLSHSNLLKAGNEIDLLKTKQGKAGVAICSEWFLPFSVRESVQQGAEFLLSLNQNGHFDQDFVPAIQHGMTRFRAIENRRDVAITSNYGYSGKVAASGISTKYARSKTAQCLSVEMTKYGHQTIYNQFGNWLPMLCLPFSIVLLILVKFNITFSFFEKNRKRLFPPTVYLKQKKQYSYKNKKTPKFIKQQIFRPLSILLLLLIFQQDAAADGNLKGLVTFGQGHYRWRNDDGLNNAATYAAPEDVPINLPADKNIRLRLEIHDFLIVGGAGLPSSGTLTEADLEVGTSLNGPWTLVTSSSSPFRYYDSPNVIDNAPTSSDELTNSNIAGPSFHINGEYVETDLDHYNVTMTLATMESWELEFSLMPNNAILHQDYYFRVSPLVVAEILDRPKVTITNPCPTDSVVYVNAFASGNRYGTSWVNAFTDLQDAIDLVNKDTCNNITQIWVARGTYRPSKDKNQNIPTDPRDATFFFDKDIKVYGGFFGFETSPSQRGNPHISINKTVLEGDIGVANDDSDNVYTVLHTEDVSNDFILDGFFIQNGNANGSGGERNLGGGWFNDDVTGISDPTIRKVIFKNNKASFGGGMFNRGTFARSNPILDKCIFWGNSANVGGGLFSTNGVGPGNSGNANPTVTNCLFFENSAVSRGGAFGYTDSDISSPYFINTTFYNNTAPHGGAIGIFAWENGQQDPFFTNCIFWNNSSTFGQTSGGIGSINIFNSIIQESSCPTGVNCSANILFATDPLFFNEAINDLRLQSCSPAIDIGVVALPSDEDIDGLPRPANAGYDLGAHEFQGTLTNLLTCYEDLDGDGYGNKNVTLPSCDVCPQGFTENDSDCDDGDGNDVDTNISGNPVPADFYYANNSVSSASNIVVGVPGVDQVIFQAGHEVILNVGFVAAVGSDFQALIEADCTPPIVPLVQLESGDETEKENELLEITLDEEDYEIELEEKIDGLKIFPNPLSEQTTIAYTLQKEEQIQLNIYDLQGRFVQSLLQNMLQAKGQHQQSVDASQLKSGIYMVVLRTAKEVQTARMVVLSNH